MLARIPLLIVPFIVFNLGLAGALGDGDPWAATIFSMPMISGGLWTLSAGDLLVLSGLALLLIEIVKASRGYDSSVTDHMLSMVVFVAFLVEFLLVRGAAHPVFFILMAITLVDVLGGFVVSLRGAGRDVSYNR
ncbi:MAG: hypothetical protein IPL47_04790 [Phyllobacteriaceae bacterium]|nr:hypothetical protein [Phyllobacteriaceae bacterium]